jgi:hypothetical protein
VRTTVILSTSWSPRLPAPGLATRAAHTLRVWMLLGMPVWRAEALPLPPVPAAEMVEGDWFDPATREQLNAAAAEQGVEVPLQ